MSKTAHVFDITVQKREVRFYAKSIHLRWFDEKKLPNPDQTLPHRKYRYQINFAQALSTMKDTIVKCLYGLISMQGYRQLLETMRQNLTIIRPGRHFERKKQSGATKKFHPCYKRML